MKTYQECKDRVMEIELGLTWDDWMLHHDLPKGRFVIEYEQQAADMYADQFKIKLSPDRVLTQKEFNNQYEHYQELLNLEDVAGFYADQFSMAHAERNKLKEAAPEPTEEEVDQAAVNSIRYDNYALSFKDGAYWYKQKTNRK